MAISTQVLALPAVCPGSQSTLVFHSFSGPNSTRSAYIQAGLHADEHPGLLVMQHLMERLSVLEREQRIHGEIVLCPFANPLGLAQNVFGYTTGRFNLANGENFNRNFPDISPRLREEIAARPPQPYPRSELKALMGDALAEQVLLDPVAANKQHLLAQALRHDLVLDLHCDTAGVLHLYSSKSQHDRAVRLAESMNIEVVFLEDEAGGQPFDESYAKPWKLLAQAGWVTEADMGFAASIELRGQADVNDEMAREDAEGILRFLAQEGLLDLGSTATAPTTVAQVYPLEGASHLQAVGTGLLLWKKQPGDTVTRGELIAQIVQLDAAPGTPRLPVHSDIDGKLIVQPLFKWVRSGQRVALIAGLTPLPNRKPGQLLQHF